MRKARLLTVNRRLEDMQEKKRNIMAAVLAVLLGISLFFNGWMIHEFKMIVTQVAPKNLDF